MNDYYIKIEQKKEIESLKAENDKLRTVVSVLLSIAQKDNPQLDLIGRYGEYGEVNSLLNT